MDLQNKWGKPLLTLVAVMLAVLAFWLSKSLLEKQKLVLTQELTAQYTSKSEIIVANQDLEAGTFLSSANLSIAQAPDQFLPVDVITPEQFNAIDGLELTRPIPKGRPILQSYLGEKLARKFSNTIPSGFRAITLNADTLNSHENMIEVGDRVDLFTQTEQQLLLLHEMAQVIATGNLRSASTDPDGTLVGDDSNYTDYQSMTLILPFPSIAKVRFAEKENNLVVMLRNPNDTQPIKTLGAGLTGTSDTVQFLSNKQSDRSLMVMSSAPEINGGDI